MHVLHSIHEVKYTIVVRARCDPAYVIWTLHRQVNVVYYETLFI